MVKRDFMEPHQKKKHLAKVKQTQKSKTLLTLSGLAVFMLLAAFLSVPLYDTFCRITGFEGEPRRSDKTSDKVLNREILVRFDANHAKDLPWLFRPLQTQMTLKIGEQKLAYYRVTNRSDKPIYGTAVYNVIPFKVAPYFIKLECFCFQEQMLEPGETIDMPVLFYIDPGYVKDNRVKKVTEVTLSYTFYRMDKEKEEAKT